MTALTELMRLREIKTKRGHDVNAAFAQTAWDKLPEIAEYVKRLEDALAWYGEQSRLCRLIHSGGDAGRGALADDGGKRARSALQESESGE